MRILIASKFFYTRGGAELVAINTRRMLIERGHDVRVLAMDYPRNLMLPERSSFPSEVKLFGGLKDKVKGAVRMLGYGETRSLARKVLHKFMPDVVHMHNVHSYLSPVVASEAHKLGIRVVWTLHDYKPLCPSYSCRRPDGTICEACFSNPWAVLRHRCMKGKVAPSSMAYLEALAWSRRRLEGIVDTYISPSAFLANKMMQGGYRADKIEVLCNFVDPDKLEMLEGETNADISRQPYFAYIGRLSAEKGVETMLKAAEMANVNLKIAGDGPLSAELKSKYGQRPGVDFLGHLDARAVGELLRGSCCSVLPSEWYENNPLGVIESLSTGTPVIGADIGGIPELILPPRDGFVYPSGDAASLAECMQKVLRTEYSSKDIARSARQRFGMDVHYKKLMRIYAGNSVGRTE